MSTLGINICKDKISYCLLDGTRASCRLELHSVERFDSTQSLSDMANYFRQAFEELINKYKPDRIAYRLSLEGKKNSIPYLCFPFGILHLIAYERGIPVSQSISQTFSAAALGRKGDKFSVCDQIIGDIPSSKWNNDHRYAALAAWIALDA